MNPPRAEPHLHLTLREMDVLRLLRQRVGPELKKLQAKYKDDRETLNKEMMAFYQENNINPFSSCLTMNGIPPASVVTTGRPAAKA